MVKLLALAATALLAITVRAQADPIVIKGSKFFYKTNGSQFYIRGVDYQQDPTIGTNTDGDVNDPLADSAGCQRDLPYLLQLRTNTVRVYAIDPTKDHDSCMNLFASNGIYVLADLSSPDLSIDRAAPNWDTDLYNRYTSVIDLMQKYTNTLGFFAGNEVANNLTNVDSLPFVKAAVRDMKAYIKSKGYRAIGVGYATDDDATIRQYVRPFMNCGTVDSSVDFFGYNIYEWCGSGVTYQSSGYAARTAEFANYSVPVFFAEYGCVTPPRLFDDTPALFSDPMDQVWSGGLVYEYFQDTNGYGLVTIVNSAVSTLTPFAAYSTQIATVSPSSISSSAYNPTNTALQACPTKDGSFTAATNLPPTPNESLCGCAVSNANCVANSDIEPSAIEDLFGYICSQKPQACVGIVHNGTTGIYGTYSMCSAEQQLTIAMNAYYLALGSSPQACNFANNATIASPSVNASCSSAISSAGGATGAAATGSNTNGGGSSSSSSAASASPLPAFDFGPLLVGIYTVLALASGVGIFML